MKKISFSFIVLLVLSMVLTACGSKGPVTKMDVTMTDFKYDPMIWNIVAGQEITMNIRNDGAVKHEFVIMKYGLSAGDKFGDEDEGNIYWEVELDPGASKTVTFSAPTDLGDYEVLCGTEGHLEAGMKASLTVSAAP